MRSMSVSEFVKFCEELNPSCYVFATDNQRLNTEDNTLRIIARYKIMVTFFNPNTICFKDDNSSLCFERVKKVIIEQETKTVGTVFTIVCGDKHSPVNDSYYTLIAD